MPEIVINESDLDRILRARQSFASSFGGVLDGKRPTAWAQYGWPETLTFEHLYNAYERTGPGFGAVHRILDRCWQHRPRIKAKGSTEPTPWETALDEMLTAIEGWQKLREFDRRNLVGRFSGLILRVADGKKLRDPLERGTKLVDMVPVFEGQMQVTEWHSDEADAENYGKPRMWQYRRRNLSNSTDTQGRPEQWADVHPTRVIILAEGAVGDDVFDGVPLLRSGFNALVDLEKITGGSAEGFLKNAARTLVFKYDVGASPQAITTAADGTTTTKTVRQVHEEQTRALNANQDSSVVIQGGDAKTLQTTVVDPRGAWEVAANTFAAAVQIPYTILFGQQTGRLASDEDQAEMTARCSSRQVNVLTPVIERIVRRLQACGIVPEQAFEVAWQPLDAPTQTTKAETLGKLTAAMKQASESGLSEPLFDANELREVAGFDQRADDGMPDPSADPPADPAADPQQQEPAQQQRGRRAG